MEIEIDGKKWAVIKEYPKKRREKDMFLCVDKYGIRECFLRCQIESLPDYRPIKKCREGVMTEAVIKQIEEELKKGTSRMKIIEIYNHISPNRVAEVIAEKRKELGITRKQKRNGLGVGREVLQYDNQMNLIAEYPSVRVAEKESGEGKYIIKNICNGGKSKSKFIWRWADDQQ